MDWLILVIAGFCEVGWAIGLKYTDGFRRLGPSLATLGLLAVSMVLLATATRSLPIGTAYAVWVG
ncbi:MAG: QacE family quaternary ammonium compound efflux SMR transporter, partial [Deltaproteobacteria bacterium]